MKRCSGTALLVFVVAVGAYAVADNLPQPPAPVPKAPVRTDSTARSRQDNGSIPPLLIQVGEHEMLRDDSVRVAKKALSDGIPVKFEIWPGMVHVFQIRGLPESREAIAQIAEFMRSKLPKP